MKTSRIQTSISQVNPFPLFHPKLNQITFYHFNQNQTLLCLISSLDGWQLRTLDFFFPVFAPTIRFLISLRKSIVHQKREVKISFNDAKLKGDWKIEFFIFSFLWCRESLWCDCNSQFCDRNKGPVDVCTWERLLGKGFFFYSKWKKKTRQTLFIIWCVGTIRKTFIQSFRNGRRWMSRKHWKCLVSIYSVPGTANEGMDTGTNVKEINFIETFCQILSFLLMNRKFPRLIH